LIVVLITLMHRALEPSTATKRTADVDASLANVDASLRRPRPSIPPPSFRIFKSRNGITAVVVGERTTDDELASLLWFFREKVRSRDFQSLGIQPFKQGRQRTIAGMLVVFRGSRCANEDFEEAIGSCGRGEHDSATYQWGVAGDTDKDSGYVRSADGEPMEIINYKDGWQPLAPKERRATALLHDSIEDQARTLIAKQLDKTVRSLGFDMGVSSLELPGGPSLVLRSSDFKNTMFRVQFLRDVLPQWKVDLCKVGFVQVNITNGGLFDLGQTYGLGCK
jgi:hypothetical protein